MNISRRFFIGGLASAAALGPRGLFAAEPGAFADGKPNLAFGLLSDVHIALAKGGRKQVPSRSTKYLEKALAYFRDNGVHAVVIAGDITNDGVFGELKAVADACRVSEAESGRLLPLDTLFADKKELILSEKQERLCRVGNSFAAEGEEGEYRFYAPSGEFLAYGSICAGQGRTIKSFFEV